MKSKEWKIPYRKPLISEELENADFGPLLRAVLAVRGVSSEKEARALIDSGPEILHEPLLMKGMEKGVMRLRKAIAMGETVAVYGDYDVDGITSTCLVTDYLCSKRLKCIPYIPDRTDEGYGLNCDAVKLLHDKGVTLLISVDCGITAVEEAEYASSMGMDMIITDHHECKDGSIPNALTVIDPKQDGDSYPNENLAGVGVALKLVCACEGNAEKIINRYSDLAAVGTIADVMPLTDENRYLVRLGLKKLERSPRPGFAAIFREACINRKKLSASTVGFSLAPRLNAAGRLCQTDIAEQLLMCCDEKEAERLAAKLCELNRERQNIETQIWEEAQAALEGKTPEGPIVLASENWHQGVIGIAASKLSEQYSVPAIMICLNGNTGKGSCRSFGGFNLFEALSACSEHLLSFGGHALAAGLTVEKDKLDDFRAALTDYYKKNKPEAPPAVSCDLLIPDSSLLSIENVRELDKLEPYGSGNPQPVMCIAGAQLESAADVGGGRHMKLRVSFGEHSFDGIFFTHTVNELGIKKGDMLDIAFSPQINEFRGRVSVQLLVYGLRKHESEELCLGILNKDSTYAWGAASFCPDRRDFVKIWRGLGRNFQVGTDLSALLSQKPAGMADEKYCICLMAFMETGLLKSRDGGIYNAVCSKIEGKADLEGSSIIRTLRAVKYFLK